MTPEHKALVAELREPLGGSTWTGTDGIMAKAAAAIETLSAQSAQPQAGEAVEKPYAYEFGRSNGDDTYSVFIKRSLPAKPHPDWPVKPLYASPQPANPAQGVSDVLREALDFVNEASGAALGIAMSGSDHPNPDEVLMDLSRKGMDLAPRLTAAIGAGGQAVAVAVKPLDLSTVLRHAFLSGVNAARCLEFGDECDGPKLWTAYEPYEPGAYSRILSALSQPHPADERVVEALRAIAVGRMTASDAAYVARSALAQEGRNG